MNRPISEIARRIDTHLKRFAPKGRVWWITMQDGWPCVRVAVLYSTDTVFLTRDEADTYLAWLDAGNAGQHYRALEETDA